ncbi:unnamed protein product [Psylliodes chrysocephalus]|uniref:DUF8207 domain-containing protein n=1 Tax=Psylliodes chrysocephalus TaxID=3402493 RepID=A0A9P0CNW5_9CUCU|nr:unnamed protein product [Psylliodes chrysocephala]
MDPLIMRRYQSGCLVVKLVVKDKRTGLIETERKQIIGTPGLFQLIFYNKPVGYNNDDLKNYKSVLETTNVHRDTRGRLAHSSKYKYTKIIKPMFSRQRNVAGTGMSMKYNNYPVEYVYWDSPNELVDRLKLLVASQSAGNNSHDNKIVAIINEPREVNIIC